MVSESGPDSIWRVRLRWLETSFPLPLRVSVAAARCCLCKVAALVVYDASPKRIARVSNPELR